MGSKWTSHLWCNIQEPPGAKVFSKLRLAAEIVSVSFAEVDVVVLAASELAGFGVDLLLDIEAELECGTARAPKGESISFLVRLTPEGSI